MSLTVLEKGSTMDPPFPLGVEDVIREDFGTNYLKVEGLRAGVAGLEFCPPSPPDFEAELLEMLLRGDWTPLSCSCSCSYKGSSLHQKDASHLASVYPGFILMSVVTI